MLSRPVCVTLARVMSVTARFFVGGLPLNCTSAELKSRFEAYGSVSGVNVRKKGGVAFGFVNVDLSSEAAAAQVVNGLNNCLWRDQRLKVQPQHLCARACVCVCLCAVHLTAVARQVERAKDDPVDRKRPATFEAAPQRPAAETQSAAVPVTVSKVTRPYAHMHEN